MTFVTVAARPVYPRPHHRAQIQPVFARGPAARSGFGVRTQVSAAFERTFDAFPENPCCELRSGPAWPCSVFFWRPADRLSQPRLYQAPRALPIHRMLPIPRLWAPCRLSRCPPRRPGSSSAAASPRLRRRQLAAGSCNCPSSLRLYVITGCSVLCGGRAASGRGRVRAGGRFASAI